MFYYKLQILQYLLLNKQDYYLPVNLYLVRGPKIIEDNERIVLLKPREKRNVFFLIDVPGDLKQNVIRPRKYGSLLFGEVIGRDLDLFAFWHSSQRNDPGLNIAMYANPKADSLLETARASNRLPQTQIACQYTRLKPRER